MIEIFALETMLLPERSFFLINEALLAFVVVEFILTENSKSKMVTSQTLRHLLL